jgi:hypothetical protein
VQGLLLTKRNAPDVDCALIYAGLVQYQKLIIKFIFPKPPAMDAIFVHVFALPVQ